MDAESKFLKNIVFYHQACGIKNLDEDAKKIGKVLKIKSDIPVALIGLFRELCFYKPQYYWKREVAEEVDKLLSTYINNEIEQFLKGFENSSTEFFESIRAYENITKTISEIRNVAFEESFKTRLFRNPIFGQICEDFLMNLYRVLKNIINEYTDKDYSNLNTLGQIIPCLVKNGFTKSSSVNLDLRNAVNHGNVFVDGDGVLLH